jgi:hypothetical protein
MQLSRRKFLIGTGVVIPTLLATDPLHTLRHNSLSNGRVLILEDEILNIYRPLVLDGYDRVIMKGGKYLW